MNTIDSCMTDECCLSRIQYAMVNMSPDIALIVYDFDGVMTDNTAIVGEDGTEYVKVHRGDGTGVRMLKELGIRQAILSTETNSVVQARANKLGLEAMIGMEEKGAVLKEFCKAQGIPLERTAFVGNDLNDWSAMEAAGLSIAPRDARPEILHIADIVLTAPGGGGVVREIADLMRNAFQQAGRPLKGISRAGASSP